MYTLRAALPVGADLGGSGWTKGEPNQSGPTRPAFSGFRHAVPAVRFFGLCGDREHATPAGFGSRGVQLSPWVNSSIGHRSGGNNNVTDPPVVGANWFGFGWFGFPCLGPKVRALDRGRGRLVGHNRGQNETCKSV